MTTLINPTLKIEINYDATTVKSSYVDAANISLNYLNEYLMINPIDKNPELLNGIEQMLFYDFKNEDDLYNEKVYIIMLAHGYTPTSYLFSIYLCGSIYQALKYLIPKNGTEKIILDIINCSKTFMDFMHKCMNTKYKITNDELINECNSFVHYTYDTDNAFNQQVYIDAIERIPCTISSFKYDNGKPLFKFEYLI